ncbi:MAG: diguanylate cyclase [Ruminococcaceae bacterium]|nr:diguanylate cyclase [Oscillospiraceae bacterium]
MDKRTGSALRFPIIAEYRCDAEEGRLIGDCSALGTWLGYPPQELQSQRISRILTPDSREEARAIRSALTESSPRTDRLLAFRHRDGHVLWALVFAEIVKNPAGGIEILHSLIPAPGAGTVCETVQDELETQRLQLIQNRRTIGSLSLRVSQDPLTQIYNAASVRELSEEYLAFPERNCAVLVIDIDDFKKINDCYGHIFGDSVLICIAEAIRKLFRSQDIVGRVGGDEFFVLMKDTADTAIIRRRCEKIVETFRDMRFPGREDVRICCSVGAAVCPQQGKNYTTLFHAADLAMYRAKASGKNRCCLAGEADG